MSAAKPGRSPPGRPPRSPPPGRDVRPDAASITSGTVTGGTISAPGPRPPPSRGGRFSRLPHHPAAGSSGFSFRRGAAGCAAAASPRGGLRCCLSRCPLYCCACSVAPCNAPCSASCNDFGTCSSAICVSDLLIDLMLSFLPALVCPTASLRPGAPIPARSDLRTKLETSLDRRPAISFIRCERSF